MPSPRELITAETAAELVIASEDERTIEARLFAWDDVAQTARGPERFERGAFGEVDPSTVTLEAIGPHGNEPGVRLAGIGVAYAEQDDGPHLTVRVSRTQSGDELLALVRDRVYRRVSLVAEPGTSTRGEDGVNVWTSARLVRLGVVEAGAYPGAQVVAAGVEPMTTETAPAPEGAVIAAGAYDGALDNLRTEMLGRMAALEAAKGAPSPFAVYASLGDYLLAAQDDPKVAALLAYALADQITTNNPGVMPPTYITELKSNITVLRPAIAAFGGPGPLGDSGMSIHWPYTTVDLTTLVAAQATEKTQIQSVRVDILDGNTAIQTFAGGSDLSWQLIRRSQPSYVDLYGRIMLAGWSLTTEKTFELAMYAAGTGQQGPFAPLTASADQIRAATFAASRKVRTATGAPASFIGVASDVFAAWGGVTGLWPQPYGTFNVAGTATASTLAINVSGLNVIEFPYLASGSVVWSNETAADWREDGPFVATADDVSKLGQNRAIWSMGATAAFIPAGIVKQSATVFLEEAEAEPTTSTKSK